METIKFRIIKCSDDMCRIETSDCRTIYRNIANGACICSIEVMWQLELFHGNSFLMSEYDENNKEENHHLSDRYVKFLQKNTIKYYDRLCELERIQYLSGYGWMQGYFNIGEVMEKLKIEGIVRVPFKWLYDIRQYDRAMDGCYMEITKVG